MQKKHKVMVMGSGFAGLSAAAYLAKEGYEVHVHEKNASIGGRARQLRTDNGFVFDMGPSWYWMPGVFEKFFNDFGYSATDFYELKLLEPSFSIVFGNDEVMDVPSNYDELADLFESLEAGSAAQLHRFMNEAEFKYKTGMEKLVYKPGLSLLEFADADLIKGMFKLQVFTAFSKHVRKYFKNPKLVALMEFPVLFLGAMPQETPALYSLMNYAGLKLGTWYPMGGFGKVVDAMQAVAEEMGVQFHQNTAVTQFTIHKQQITHVGSAGNQAYDGIIAAADYQHVEQNLLPEEFRNYSEAYWNSRTLAPSCLIFYLGVSKKLPRLNHHTLFFDEGLELHAEEIYKNPRWPSKPLFYVCCPSKTDPAVAPQGHENLFLLMPIAPNLEDSEELREMYFDILLHRLENYVGENIRDHLVYKKSYCVQDFVSDYNSYKGNAYGLANTLRQTAHLKPSLKNKKISNLFYAGQLTVPGPGVPPSIISGNLAAQQLIKHLTTSYERVI